LTFCRCALPRGAFLFHVCSSYCSMGCKSSSARAVALDRGLSDPKNRMVSSSKGGAIEPPRARKTS
jgi:hypothetical protein